MRSRPVSFSDYNFKINDYSEYLHSKYNDEEVIKQKHEQLKNALRDSINHDLTGTQIKTVQMYYFENKLMREIAEDMGISVPSVCKTLKRARKRIENTLRNILYALAGWSKTLNLFLNRTKNSGSLRDDSK